MPDCVTTVISGMGKCLEAMFFEDVVARIADWDTGVQKHLRQFLGHGWAFRSPAVGALMLSVGGGVVFHWWLREKRSVSYEFG